MKIYHLLLHISQVQDAQIVEKAPWMPSKQLRARILLLESSGEVLIIKQRNIQSLVMGVLLSSRLSSYKGETTCQYVAVCYALSSFKCASLTL